MKKKGFGIAAITCLMASTAPAQSFLVDRFAFAPTGAGYAPHEFSFDIAGGYATRDKDGRDKDACGLAGGVSYFITDKIGVGADTYFDAFELPYMLNFSGIFRYPISETGLAPYGFGGFGRQWEHAAQWTGHIGAGLEFRLNTHTGVFVDGRRVFPDTTNDYCLWRFGFRFGF